MSSSVLSINSVGCHIKNLPFATSVTVAYFLDVGLPLEAHAQGGISHFLEHMCFRGTSIRTGYDITMQVDALGGQINAYTTKEFTCYFITTLPENLKDALDILTDIVFNSCHDEKNIELEKSIIREEIKMYEDTPDEKILDVFNEKLFENAYLGRPILGSSASISTFNSERLLDFYRHYFLSSNVKCVIAGAIGESQKAEDLLRDALDKVSFRSEVSERPLLTSIPFKSSRSHIEKDLEQVHVCLGYPGLSYNHPDRYALTVLSNILGGSMSSRLFQSVREKAGLAYSIYSSPSFYRDTGAIMIYAGMSKEHYNKALDCINNELKQLLNEGVSNEEFDRSRRQLRGNIIINLEGSSAWANWLGRQFIYNTGLQDIIQIEEKLNALSLDDVCRVGIDMFNKQQEVLVSLGGLN